MKVNAFTKRRIKSYLNGYGYLSSMDKKLAYIVVLLLLVSLVSAEGYFSYVRNWKAQRPNHFSAAGGYQGSIKMGNQVMCGMEGQACCKLKSGRLGCLKVPNHIVDCMPDGMCHRIT